MQSAIVAQYALLQNMIEHSPLFRHSHCSVKMLIRNRKQSLLLSRFYVLVNVHNLDALNASSSPSREPVPLLSRPPCKSSRLDGAV